MDEKLTYTDHNNIIISEVQLQKVQVSFAWMYINSILKVNGLLIFITIFIRVLSCCSVNLRAVFEGLNERNKKKHHPKFERFQIMLKDYRIKYTFVHFDKIMFHKFTGYTKKSSIVTLLVYMLIFLSIR